MRKVSKALVIKGVRFFNQEKALTALLLFFLLLYSGWSVYRHLSFQTDAIDLGIFDQAVWKYSTFQVPYNSIKFNTSPGINLLADHFHPILALLAPLYWLWPNVTLLLIAQALLVVVGALPWYLIALKKFKNRLLAFSIAFSYLAFLGVQTLIDYDFHEVALALPLLSWAFYFLLEKKFFVYLILILVSLTVKEDLPLYTLMIGVYAALQLRLYKVGLITIVISVIAYYLVTRVALPSFYLNHLELSFLNPAITNPYFSYEQLDPRVGKTTNDLLKTMVTNPAQIASVAFDLGCLNFSQPSFGVNADTCVKLRTILNLLGSFAFLPLLSPLTLLSAVPNIFSRFITVLSQRWIVRFQYSAILSPLFTLAVIDGISNLLFLKKRFKIKGSERFLYYGISFLLITAPLYFSWRNNAPLMRMLNPFNYKLENRFQVNNQLISSIPREASVMAQTAFVPHLSHRDQIYRYYEGAVDITPADYVLVSAEEHSDPPYLKEDLVKQIEGLRQHSGYESIYWDGNRLLLKRKGA